METAYNSPNIDTNSLLLARGVGGYGYGGLGGGVGGAGYTNLTSLQHGQNCISQKIEDNGGFTRDTMALNVKNISDNFESVNRSAQFTSVKDGQFQSELRTNDRLLALQMEMNSNARAADKCCCDTQKAIAEAAAAAAKCCCDAQLQACKDHADLKATVILENSATRELIRGDALAAANARIVQLETINALSGRHHG
jgi:hypothetical protein